MNCVTITCIYSIVVIIIAIVMFGVLIGIHEFGHFTAAKACGVKVNEFAIGMGPALLKKQKGETLYSLRALPIGLEHRHDVTGGPDAPRGGPRAATAPARRGPGPA